MRGGDVVDDCCKTQRIIATSSEARRLPQMTRMIDHISSLHLTSAPLIGRCRGVVVEYRTRNQEVAGSTHTRSTASNLEQVANLLCAQANSASYPQRDGK